MDKSNNGWYPIATVPKRKGVGGKPHRILVTRAPFTGMPPLNVVHWGGSDAQGGERWRRDVGASLLRYEPTHRRELPEFPAPEMEHD